jgi:glycosyltransferase involved in cell wall biosynthesis
VTATQPRETGAGPARGDGGSGGGGALRTRLKRVAPLVVAVHLGRRAARRLSPGAWARTTRWAGGIAAAIRRRRRETRLTVAVDVLPFWEPLTGIGWYLHRLLGALAGRDDLRLRLYGLALVEAPGIPGPVTALPEGPALEHVGYPVPGDLVLGRRWLVPLVRKLEPLLLAADGNRVVFAPNYILPPPFRLARAPLVATIHDLSIREVPWAVRPDTREEMERRLDRTLFEARLLITDSRAVAADLLRHGAAHPARLRPVLLGPGQIEPGQIEPGQIEPGAPAGAVPEPPAETPETYLLHVGTLEPRKNLPTLLAALRLLHRRGRPVPLVLAGRYGWKSDDLRRQVERAAAEGWLHHHGYVTPEHLLALYRRAAAAAVPSFYEGFGLPALEAMGAGAPVVLADIPVLREVAGDAALYADPRRPETWADRLGELLEDPALRRDLAARGRARAATFTWARTAEETARVLREAAGKAG